MRTETKVDKEKGKAIVGGLTLNPPTSVPIPFRAQPSQLKPSHFLLIALN